MLCDGEPETDRVLKKQGPRRSGRVMDSGQPKVAGMGASRPGTKTKERGLAAASGRRWKPVHRATERGPRVERPRCDIALRAREILVTPSRFGSGGTLVFGRGSRRRHPLMTPLPGQQRSRTLNSRVMNGEKKRAMMIKAAKTLPYSPSLSPGSHTQPRPDLTPNVRPPPASGTKSPKPMNSR